MLTTVTLQTSSGSVISRTDKDF